MRIVTRPDFDGVVCAVIISEALKINPTIKWVEPNEIQHGKIEVKKGDIIANLPYAENCDLWFDHHCSNKTDKPFKGVLKEAPSAAGIVFEYYKEQLHNNYTELIAETDKIDSANLSLNEVLNTANHPYILLSSTISSHNRTDETYWNKLVKLLRTDKINKVMDDPEVKERCNKFIQEEKEFKDYLIKHTKLNGTISITDFRSIEHVPKGNRFLIFSLFPETTVNLKIRTDHENKDNVIVNIGHSIFNKNCNVNVGLLLSSYGGGGHRGAGGCQLDVTNANNNIKKIIDVLTKNKSNE